MTDDMKEAHQHVLSLVDASGAQAVLDLGCGSGDHLRALDRIVDGRTRLVGVDHAEEAIASTQQAADGGLQIEFLLHDLSKVLPFESGAFDRVLSVNTLEAVGNRTLLLQEIHRVLAPGGRVVCAHFDWDSQVYDGADRDLVRRVVHAFADWQQPWMQDADGWMGRRLWRAFQESGLFTGSVDAFTHTSTRFEPGCYGWERARDFGSLVKRGMITADEYDAFMAGLADLAQRGGYFYAITLFSYMGTKLEK